jgi:hypothetical protein
MNGPQSAMRSLNPWRCMERSKVLGRHAAAGEAVARARVSRRLQPRRYLMLVQFCIIRANPDYLPTLAHDSQKAEFESRLALYHEAKPYRELPKTPSAAAEADGKT